MRFYMWMFTMLLLGMPFVGHAVGVDDIDMQITNASLMLQSEKVFLCDECQNEARETATFQYRNNGYDIDGTIFNLERIVEYTDVYTTTYGISRYIAKYLKQGEEGPVYYTNESFGERAPDKTVSVFDKGFNVALLVNSFVQDTSNGVLAGIRGTHGVMGKETVTWSTLLAPDAEVAHTISGNAQAVLTLPGADQNTVYGVLLTAEVNELKDWYDGNNVGSDGWTQSGIRCSAITVAGQKARTRLINPADSCEFEIVMRGGDAIDVTPRVDNVPLYQFYISAVGIDVEPENEPVAGVVLPDVYPLEIDPNTGAPKRFYDVRAVTASETTVIPPAESRSVTDTSGGGIHNPIGVDSFSDFLGLLLGKIIRPVALSILVLFLIYSGFLFVMAQGNEEGLNKAKRTFMWTVVGAAILLGAEVIAVIVENTVKQLR